MESKEKFDQERKKACQEFIMEKTMNLNAVESQKFWKEFKKITTRKFNQKINPLEDDKGGILTENEEIEQLLFSTFFECRHMEGVSFNEEFYQETNKQYANIMEENHFENEDTAILDAEITKEEVIKNIKEIKSAGKSFDNHGCHPSMIKKIGPMCLSLILVLFSLCFNMKM